MNRDVTGLFFFNEFFYIKILRLIFALLPQLLSKTTAFMFVCLCFGVFFFTENTAGLVVWPFHTHHFICASLFILQP